LKLIVCNSCDAEFKIAHNMDEHHYQITCCPFCGEPVNDPDFVDDIEWDEMDE
jgi:hydrogenase maturation factor HypF (carbamoyltransferase family)